MNKRPTQQHKIDMLRTAIAACKERQRAVSGTVFSSPYVMAEFLEQRRLESRLSDVIMEAVDE